MNDAARVPMFAAMPFLVVALLLLATPAAAQLDPSGRWPDAAMPSARVAVDSRSPFTLRDVADAPATAADVTFTPAAGASAERPSPAAILLHGAGGVGEAREGRYAHALAAHGVAVAVIDVFGARGGGGFQERLVRTTEAMALADAFATLDWLATRPDVDPTRVALIGFSYGGMSSVFAAYRQVVDTYKPRHTFAAHVAFYGPCIARFDDAATTGAPVMMLWGTQDAIMDPAECAVLADDLRAGGSRVDIATYDARHRWDGAGRSWRAPLHIAACRFRVAPDGTVSDARTGLVMASPPLRAAILALCVDRDGYLIGGDEAVRRRSDADLAAFLNPVLFPAD